MSERLQNQSPPLSSLNQFYQRAALGLLPVHKTLPVCNEIRTEIEYKHPETVRIIYVAVKSQHVVLYVVKNILALNMLECVWGEGAVKGNPSSQWGFPGGSMVKNPLAMQETRVQSLGQKDPLEKEMATYCSILAWEIS